MSTSTNWSGSKPFSKSVLCTGEGLVVEGEVVASRVHSVFVTSSAASAGIEDQEDNLPTRFIVFSLRVERAFPRMFNDDEREYNYDTLSESKKYREPAVIDLDALPQRLEPSWDAVLKDRTAQLHPKRRGVVDFFALPEERAKTVQDGNNLRIFTFGSSVFIDSFKNKDGKVNLGGGEAGQGDLANNFVGMVTNHQEKALPGADQEGVDSEEWSD